MSGVGMARAFARGRKQIDAINARNGFNGGSPLGAQRLFNLPIAARTVLVDLQTVRAAKGVDAETIVALVDNGELQWVFDLGLGGGDIRELRFWTREIIAPETVAGMALDEVINSILGQGATLRRGEIERQWVVSAPHVMRLVRANEITQVAPGKISRASLHAFLTRRHAARPQPATKK